MITEEQIKMAPLPGSVVTTKSSLLSVLIPFSVVITNLTFSFSFVNCVSISESMDVSSSNRRQMAIKTISTTSSMSKSPTSIIHISWEVLAPSIYHNIWKCNIQHTKYHVKAVATK